MQITEVTTAYGSGFWGYGTNEIELRTGSTTYSDAASKNQRVVRQYRLMFGRGSTSDLRVFTSDQTRAEFLNKHFTELRLRNIPANEQKSTALTCPLALVVGEYLSDVAFVMDYLQLSFCGPHFSLYNWPVVILADRTLDIGQPSYRDGLCGLIGKTVRSIDVYLDTGLTFKFETGETVTVSLRLPTGFTLPEVGEYSSGKHSGFIWVPGEEPFD
jgi:hypothetical protein